MSRRRAVAVFNIALLIFGCDQDTTEPGDPSGTLRVTVAATGKTLDADGYAVELDGAEAGAVGAQGTFELDSLEPATTPWP